MPVRVASTLALVASIALALATACLRPVFDPPTGPLGDRVVPTHYDLELHIDPTRERFSGSVRIALDVRTRSRVIWLHAKGLEVSQAVVVGGDGKRREASFDVVHDSGVAALHFDRPLEAGLAHAELEWEAEFNRGLRGLYRVEVGDDAYAFTQFEAISAREVFPGFDEPAFKATFDVSIVAPSNDVVLGNTPETGRVELPSSEAFPGGRSRHRFATTPPLPTYLLAWATGPLDVVDAPDIPANEVRGRAVPLRGAATRGRGPELAYALERTGAILEALERYVGSEYPFEKLDVVAVPDFAAGAMENVGLVTFRDWLLLVDPQSAAEDQRRAFASVMAHELAHQWFGNSVTMPWWNDIWLNESFATWLAARIIEDLYPEHRSEVYALKGSYHAMAGDALASARRIREPIRSTHDIRNAFDGITYQKGGAVLGMIEAAVGGAEFRAAIQAYLSRHHFGLATADDFLDVVSTELGPEWANAFRSFLDQPGVPFLRVASTCARDATREIVVEQARFRPLGSRLPAADASWQLPFCWRTGPGRSECRMIDGPRSEIQAGACGEFVHPNASGRGYYRWSLDPASLAGLRSGAMDTLDVRERMSLSDALKASFATGSVDADAVFEAAEPLARDPERHVATSVAGLIEFAKERLAVSEIELKRVEAWAGALYSERARAAGFDAAPNDDGERRLWRARMVRFAVAVAEDPALRAEALARGRRYLRGAPGTPDERAAASELLGLVAAVAVRDGGVEEFEAALGHLFASNDATVRMRMLRALGSADDPVLAKRARELLFHQGLRNNEQLHILAAQAERRETRDAAWAWLEANFDAIVETVTPERAVGLVRNGSGFCSEADARRVEEFFAPRVAGLEGAPRRLASSLERIRICAAKVERHRDAARVFFERASPSVEEAS